MTIASSTHAIGCRAHNTGCDGDCDCACPPESSSIDLTAHEAKARAATRPGPWSVGRNAEGYTIVDANGFWVAQCGQDPIQAEFIAAFSPDVVIALLRRVRAAEAQLDALQATCLDGAPG